MFWKLKSPPIFWPFNHLQKNNKIFSWQSRLEPGILTLFGNVEKSSAVLVTHQAYLEPTLTVDSLSEDSTLLISLSKFPAKCDLFRNHFTFLRFLEANDTVKSMNFDFVKNKKIKHLEARNTTWATFCFRFLRPLPMSRFVNFAGHPKPQKIIEYRKKKHYF